MQTIIIKTNKKMKKLLLIVLVCMYAGAQAQTLVEGLKTLHNKPLFGKDGKEYRTVTIAKGYDEKNKAFELKTNTYMESIKTDITILEDNLGYVGKFNLSQNISDGYLEDWTTGAFFVMWIDNKLVYFASPYTPPHKNAKEPFITEKLSDKLQVQYALSASPIDKNTDFVAIANTNKAKIMAFAQKTIDDRIVLLKKLPEINYGTLKEFTGNYNNSLRKLPANVAAQNSIYAFIDNAVASNEKVLENQILEDKTLSLRKLARKINVVADDGQKHTFAIYGVAVSTRMGKVYTKDSFDSKFEYFLGITPEGLYVVTYIVTGNANELTKVEQNIFDHTKIRGLAESVDISNAAAIATNNGLTYLAVYSPHSKFNEVNYYRSYFGGKNGKEIIKSESTNLLIDFKNPKEAQNFKKIFMKE